MLLLSVLGRALAPTRLSPRVFRCTPRLPATPLPALYRYQSTKSAMDTKPDPSCLFCKIVAGTIPSFKLAETESAFAFLDIGPLSKGHALVIPKYHGVKLHDMPDSALADILPLARNIAKALNLEDYNILQNNGRIAHQIIDHVHFHVIPKPSDSDKEGLVVGWPAQEGIDKSELNELAESIRAKLARL